ncbi:MAG: nitrogenase-stabilizing/protective protein NifW [Hydrogenophilus sp.]|nr:nitrogenase-stabilizing/protective protein NifW [Hydrogenophilus sp.]
MDKRIPFSDDPLLAELDSAEAFLDFFGIPYDPRRLQVVRLHLLQRFHDYLVADPPPVHGTDSERRAHYARLLARAYADFETGDPRREKVFAVFRRQTATIPLSALRRSSSSASPSPGVAPPPSVSAANGGAEP